MLAAVHQAWIRAAAARTSAGSLCKKYVVHGATVCATHGGSTKHVRAPAERRVAEHRAAREEAKRGAPAIEQLGDPSEVFLRAVARVELLARALEDQAAAVDPSSARF